MSYRFDSPTVWRPEWITISCCNVLLWIWGGRITKVPPPANNNHCYVIIYKYINIDEIIGNWLKWKQNSASSTSDIRQRNHIMEENLVSHWQVQIIKMIRKWLQIKSMSDLFLILCPLNDFNDVDRFTRCFLIVCW